MNKTNPILFQHQVLDGKYTVQFFLKKGSYEESYRVLNPEKEVKFFKTIRHRLEITDDDIRKAFPELDDNFIEEDIKTASFLEKITHQFLEDIELPTFDIIKFKEDEK